MRRLFEYLFAYEFAERFSFSRTQTDLQELVVLTLKNISNNDMLSVNQIKLCSEVFLVFAFRLMHCITN